MLKYRHGKPTKASAIRELKSVMRDGPVINLTVGPLPVEWGIFTAQGRIIEAEVQRQLGLWKQSWVTLALNALADEGK